MDVVTQLESVQRRYSNDHAGLAKYYWNEAKDHHDANASQGLNNLKCIAFGVPKENMQHFIPNQD